MARSAISKTKPKKRVRRKAERRRLIVVFLVSAVITAGGIVAGTQLDLLRPAAKAVAATNGGEIYTGSILFVPDDGKTCHQFLFDNRTGLINDNGMIDCARAYYQSTAEAPRHLSSARAQEISEGFRNH